MFRSLRDHFRPTLARKLGFLVLASTGLVFALAFGYSHHISRGLMLKAAEENTRNLARGTVSRIDALLRAVEPLPWLVANRVARSSFTEPEVAALLEDELRAGPHIFGGTVAFAPGQFSPSVPLCAPYVCGRDGAFQTSNLANDGYDYVSQDWYLIPRETGRAVWSDPYYDEGGGEDMMCTYCVPFYRQVDGKRVFAGVATADVLLEHFAQIVSSLKLYQGGYAFLLSQNGQIVSHPNKSYVYKESIFSLADEAGDPQWRAIGREMLRGGEGYLRTRSPNTGQVSWLYYAPVSNGWSVGILFPEAEVLADLNAMNRGVGWIGAAGFALLLGMVALLSMGVTRPIRTLARQTHQIALGNLELAVPPILSRDEVGDLSQSFENMRLALKEYVANLAATTAAKERIESELQIAHTIQGSFLPKRFPPFPDHSEFEIHADLRAAKEVGGDLYDFFLLDERHLFFSIGDVSGKGVPAALFMAVTKTLMKGVAEQRLTPSQVLEKVNHELSVDNDQMMFVTLVCGALDLRTGELRYSNAGHLPPLLLRPSGPAVWVELPKGAVLGVADDPVYTTKTIQLEPMDTLLFFTDGVNEAMNPAKQFYGDARLREFADAKPGRSPKELVEGLVSSVQQFAGDETQSDDITVLALRFCGKK
jgi:phosphoserine phosphatase RsbU/P